jgi:hypothetical protein
MTAGLYISGDYLSLREGKTYTTKAGAQVAPWAIRILCGDAVLIVEMASFEAAEKALGGAEVGDEVAIECRAQAWDSAKATWARISYRGR